MNLDIIKRNPILVFALVNSLIVLALSFGFELSDIQISAIYGFANVILAIFTGTMVMPITVANQKIEIALKTPAPDQDAGKAGE